MARSISTNEMWNCSTEYTKAGGLPKTEEGVASIIDGGEAKDLFDETTTTEIVEKGFTFGKDEFEASPYSNPTIWANQTTTEFYPTNIYVGGKKLVGIGAVLGKYAGSGSTPISPTNPINVVVRNFGVTALDLKYSATVPTTPADILCKIMPTDNDIGKYVVYRLDGTDSRVSEINQNYVQNGKIVLPEGYHIGFQSINSSYINFAYVNPARWSYQQHQFLGTPNTGNNTKYDGTIILDPYWEEEVTSTDFQFDKYAKKEEEIKTELVPAYRAYFKFTTAGSGASATHYCVRGSHIWNNQLIKGIGIQIQKNRSVTFGITIPNTNNNNLISTTPSTSTTPVPIFTINAGDGGFTTFGAGNFNVYRLDGTDPHVTIHNTEYYDAELKGFRWQNPWVLCFVGPLNASDFYYINGDVQNNSFSLTTLGTNGRFSSTYNTVNLAVNLYKEISVKDDTYYHSNVLNEIKEEISSPLKGKYLSLIGDSITTFEGWSNIGGTAAAQARTSGGGKTYYPKKFLTDVHQTYWMKLCDRTGMRLLVNESWTGSHCSNYGNGPVVATGNNDRCRRLHRDGIYPDYILINIGTNDFSGMTGSDGKVMGTWNGRGEAFPANPDSTAPVSFREAYAVMLYRLRRNYPLAKVYCCTVPCGDVKKDGGQSEINGAGYNVTEINDAIREIATAFGARIIELATSGLDYWTLTMLYGDYTGNPWGETVYNLHPSEAGMERYYEIIRKAMENDDSSNVSCPRKSNLLTGTASSVSDSTATDVSGIVTDFNSLLTNLRNRGVIS